MKNQKVILALFSVFALISCGENPNPVEKSGAENEIIKEEPIVIPEGMLSKYGMESGILETTIILTGINQRGKTYTKLYFDHWGLREAKHITDHEEKEGGTVVTESLEITDGEWTTSIDLDKRTATKFRNPNLDNLKAAKNWVKYVESEMEGLAKKKSGNVIYKDRRCEKWKGIVDNSEIYTYKGLTMLETGNFAGITSWKIETESLQENAKITEDKFMLPSDIVPVLVK